MGGPPLDFYASLFVLFGETYCYYLFSYLLMTYLVDAVGLGNVYSGFVYAAFGAILMVFTMVFGSVIDRLLLRRTLLLHLSVSFVSCLLFSISNNVYWTCFVLFGPFSFALAVGLPSIPVAIRRFTSESAQTYGFICLFVVMNIATALTQISVDLFRIHLVPLSQTGTLGFLPAYSVLFLLMAMPHFVNFVVVVYFVRDVYVVNEEWELAEFVPASSSDVKPVTVLKNPHFWYFVLLSLATTGAKSIYRYLDSLYPLYMRRQIFGEIDSVDVPYMTFLLFNPILASILTPLFGWFVARNRFHPFDVIFAGCLISSGAPFLMMIVEYWAVLLFIILLTIGESLWAPMLQKYTNDFCEPGTEGIFFALATIPVFSAKIVSGSLAGILLERYCWARGNCTEGWTIWFIIGCITVSSPLLLLLTCRWTRLKTFSS